MTIQIILIVLWISSIGFLFLQSREWLQSLKQLLEHQTDQMQTVLSSQKEQIKTEGFKTMLPLRIQASERLVLFLERLQPPLLVARYMPESLMAADLAQFMLKGIREEFDYNLSQQLFITGTAWQLTKAAKEEIIQLIYLSLSQIPAEADKNSLAGIMLESEVQLVEKAIQRLRDELNHLIFD